MKHIVMCSFGKDSMAMLYTMKKYNLPIDMIVYVRIMFDKDTPAEIPEHEKWIEEYPELWQKICDLDFKSNIKFKQKLSANEITKKLIHQQEDKGE